MSPSSPATQPCRRAGEGEDPAGSGAHADHHELRTDHLLGNIGQRSMRGGAVMFGAQALKAVAQFGSVLVLVRLLAPADFGLIAMTAALYAVLDPLRDLGLSAATIQKSDITHAQISTLFWCNVATGTVLAAILFVTAPLIAAFYHQPELTAVTRWVALGFVLSGVSSQHWALLRRQMRFTAIATLETGAELLSFAVAIALAVGGVGYWALVVQRLVAPMLIALGCWILCRWRPSPPALAAGTPALIGFGGSLAATGLTTLLARSIDSVLIGWYWGANPLGLYDRANKLLTSPLNNIILPLYSIGLPALSRLAADETRYRRAFGQILEKLAMIMMPGAVAVAATADWTTLVLFGPKWTAAAPILGWLALIAAYQPLMDTCGLLFMTQMRSRELLGSSLLDAALRILAIAAGLKFGVVAVAAALALSGALRVPVLFWLATRRGPVRLGQLYGALLPSTLAAGAVAAAIGVLRHFVLPPGTGAALGLAAAVPTGLASAVVVFSLLPKSRRALAGVLDARKLLWGGAS